MFLSPKQKSTRACDAPSLRNRPISARVCFHAHVWLHMRAHFLQKRFPSLKGKSLWANNGNIVAVGACCQLICFCNATCWVSILFHQLFKACDSPEIIPLIGGVYCFRCLFCGQKICMAFEVFVPNMLAWLDQQTRSAIFPYSRHIKAAQSGYAHSTPDQRWAHIPAQHVKRSSCVKKQAQIN